MIGGGGERKTLRLVAQYADACNVFGGPETIHHKYEVLREHCAAVGRDPDEIERSTLQTVRLALDGGAGDSPSQVVDRFGELSEAGAQHVIFSVRDAVGPAGDGDPRRGTCCRRSRPCSRDQPPAAVTGEPAAGAAEDPRRRG